MFAFPDAARAVMGVMPSPRSRGGSISLLMGEPPGLVPGGPGDRHDPHLCQNGQRPAAREWRLKSPQRTRMIPEAPPRPDGVARPKPKSPQTQERPPTPSVDTHSVILVVS